ncbi:MAG TPA: hypothetical protein PLG86_07160 [Bacteroidales bacterium]|nr:hypothetical protein [Bacteroidales bacterium]
MHTQKTKWLLAVSCLPLANNYQLTTNNYQLSTINYQLTTINSSTCGLYV